MGSRSSHRRPHPRTARFRTVRFKVISLVLVSLVSLATLWAFAASVTLGEGLNLRNVKTVQDHFEYPSGALGSALQVERRLTLVFLGSRTTADRAAMESGRLVTDRQAALFRRLAGDSRAQDAAPAQGRRLANEIISGLNALGAKRGGVDAGSTARPQAFADYTGLLSGIGALQGSLSTLSNPEVAKDARNQIALARAREALSQEDAQLAGALAAGRMTRAEHAEFVKLVGTQRSLFDIAAPELRTGDRTYFGKVTGTPEYARLRTLEDRVVGTARMSKVAADMPVLWKTTADANLTRLRGLELSLAAQAEQRAKPISDGILLRVVLAGALGLVAVIATVLMAIWVARSVIRDLTGLKREALDLADRKLPGVISRLRHGQEVDVAAEAPPLEFRTAEIDQVGQAFNAARRTAIQGAVEEAALRRGISEVFVNLARRSQTLLHRQLKLLDSMERRISEPDDLEDLFRIDHLATRMRRHAEGLIILSGQAPGRGWRNPVAVIDVARAAASEVEDYTRVSVAPMPPAALSGVAVADIVHLLAELIENAAAFSPPHTNVQVTGQAVAHGFTIEIEDRGLGMDEANLAAANARLAAPPEFDLSDSAQLGLFVVGRLAQRHRIKVTLRASPFGGMSAIVLLPEDLVVKADGSGFGDAPFALTRRSEDALVPAGVVRGNQGNALPQGGSVLRLHAGEPPTQQPPAQQPPTQQPPTPQPAQPFARPPSRLPAEPRAAEPVFGEQRYAEPPFSDPRFAGPPVGEPPMNEPPGSEPEPFTDPHFGQVRPRAEARPPARPARRESPPPGGKPAGGGRPNLPKRVRQANIAPQLRAEANQPAPAPVDSAPRREDRSPEELRNMMSSIQRGTRRGRAESARPDEET